MQSWLPSQPPYQASSSSAHLLSPWALVHIPSGGSATPPPPSAVRAATVQAKMLSGRYPSCWLRRHWTGESGACRLPACGAVPGDVAHLVSAKFPALQPQLNSTMNHLQNLLAPHPSLLKILQADLDKDSLAATEFILDPSTDPQVIKLCQIHQRGAVLQPLFRACRAWIWAAHRTRMRLLGLEQYLV